MARSEHPSEHGTIAFSDDRARAVDEAGRRAGAALRSPAPAHGAAAVRTRARRRRAVRVVAAASGAGVVFVAGVMAFTSRDPSEGLQPVDTPTLTTDGRPEPVSPSTVETTAANAPIMASIDLVETGALSGLPWPRYSTDSSLLAIESSDHDVVIHDSATLTQLGQLPCPTALEALPGSTGTGPDPDLVWDVPAAAAWEASTLTVLTSVSRPPMCGVTVVAEGTRAVTDADVGNASRNRESLTGRSLLWDTADGSLVAVIPGRLIGVGADGSTMVMSDGPSVSIVDAATGAVLVAVTDDAVGTVASPDGTRVLRWGSDTDPEGAAGDATIYDTQTLTPVATLSAGSNEEVARIEDPVFDDTGHRIAALDGSGMVVWDATTGAQLQHVSIELVSGRSVAFFPGGDLIAVRNGNHITIVSSSTGGQLADLDLGAESVEELVFSPDGSSLAAGTTSGVRVWSYITTPLVAAPTDDEPPATVTTSAPPRLSPEEIRITSDLIEYGDDLVVPVDRVASDGGRHYVLAGLVDQERGGFNTFATTAVLAAFDESGVEQWRIWLDGRPSDVVVVDGDPWVLMADDASVSRISAADGAVLGSVTLSGVWDGQLIGADGRVWVLATSESGADVADLVGIGPDLSTSTTELPGAPRGSNDASRGPKMAAGAGAIWVPLFDTTGALGVAVIDTDTNEVAIISAVTIGHEVHDVAVDGDVVYVASDTTVSSIVDGRVVATVSFPSTSTPPGAIAYLGPTDGAFGVLLQDEQFLVLEPNDPMVTDHRRLDGDHRGSCIGPRCQTYGWGEIDGEAWIESLAPTWALARLRLLPSSDDGG